MTTQRILRLPLLLLLTASLAFAEEGTFNKMLTVSGTPDVEIQSGSGNITVHVGSGNQIAIVGHVKTSNAAWAFFSGSPEEKVKEIVNNPPVEQSGSWVRIGKINDERLRSGVSISYDVTLPKETHLRSNTGSGDIRIDDVAGNTIAHTGSGNIRIHNLGAELEAQAGSGDVEADGVQGAVRATTGSGNLHIRSKGNGYVRAHTGSGDVTITDVNGGLDASTGSGNIHAGGKIGDNWKLQTGSGDVRVTLPRDAKFNINARSSSGSVHTDLPITINGSMERHTIRGTVNGGGPTLEIHTGSGNIEIQ
jgi:hypothetical protein